MTFCAFLDPKGRWSSRSSEGSPLLCQGELADIGDAFAKETRAAGEIAHESVVHLFGLDGDGAFAIGLQIGRPGVQSPGVMLGQQLDFTNGEPAGL